MSPYQQHFCPIGNTTSDVQCRSRRKTHQTRIIFFFSHKFSHTIKNKYSSQRINIMNSVSQHSRHSTFSTYSTCSAESQPQSIVHQIIRLENKVEKKVKKIFGNKGNKKSLNPPKPLSCGKSLATATASASKDDGVSVCSLSSMESFFLDDHDDVPASGPLDADLDLDFETVDQNILLSKVLMDTVSGANCFVHFFNEDYDYHESEDYIIQLLASDSSCSSKNLELYRVSSQKAPLFTARLGIDIEKSTLIHVRNGKILRRLNDLSSAESRHLLKQEWLTEVVATQTPFGSITDVLDA